MPRSRHAIAHHHPFVTALALSLGAAISLGMARFSYALLLPPMRADLGWSYTLAGAMNTANAVGYLLGALATPALMRRFDTRAVLVGGAIMTGLFMLLSGFAIDARLLLTQRVLAGVASAFIFVSGGVLAARLGSMHPRHAGLLIGIFYGGTGIGIALSALFVPAAIDWAARSGEAHAWQAAWIGLGAVCLAAIGLMIWPIAGIDGSRTAAGTQQRFGIRRFAFGLAGYFMFGVGYIGYMTFVIALLKEQGMAPGAVTAFYALLGMAVVASSRIWAGMLNRFKGGRSMAILNALLGIAVLLPAWTAAPGAMYLSGLLFGAVFISVVASTTALVRHNAPPAAWSSGISLFTIVFAFGQIVGPAIVGWIADQSGGLRWGLVFSAGALFAGALLASRQRPVQSAQPA